MVCRARDIKNVTGIYLVVGVCALLQVPAALVRGRDVAGNVAGKNHESLRVGGGWGNRVVHNRRRE